MKHTNKEARKFLRRVYHETVVAWSSLTESLDGQDDLSAAFDTVQEIMNVPGLLRSRLSDGYFDYIVSSDYIDYYEAMQDGGAYGLEQAADEAEQEVDEMIGEGLADPGYEEEVQEALEDNVLPGLDAALDTFKSEFRLITRDREETLA